VCGTSIQVAIKDDKINELLNNQKRIEDEVRESSYYTVFLSVYSDQANH
jgi:hypothetical protein